MKLIIYLMTHGKKEGYSNPPLTEYGKGQIRALKKFLPSNIKKVIVGLALRHENMVTALDFTVEECYFSVLLGKTTSLKPGTVNQIFLSSGTIININKHIDFPPSAVWEFVKDQPNNTLLLGGRPLATAVLTFATHLPNPPKALTATLYKITIENGKITDVEYHSEGKVEADVVKSEV